MDEDDLADLRVIELALQNPRPGSLAARVIHHLSEQSRARDAKRFPTLAHAITGALCFCQSHCEGANCHCWCHDMEAS